MKLLVVASALLVAVSAQHYNGPYHIPVIGPNGVPQEPPEVVAERNKHLAAYQRLPQPQAQYNPPQQQWNQPQQQQQWGQPPQQQWQQPQAQYAPPQPRYTGPLARVGPDGMPQYDQAVAQARAAHQAAYAEVNSRNAALHAQVPPANHWQG